jgi:hypothetical protein
MQPQMRYEDLPRHEGYRKSAIRESRIKDRPTPKTGASDSALKIKIELDLEIEVDLYARVKGDGMFVFFLLFWWREIGEKHVLMRIVTIGLM